MKVTRRTNARAVSKALKQSLGDLKAVRNEGYKDGYARGLEDAAKVADRHPEAPGRAIASTIRKLGEGK